MEYLFTLFPYFFAFQKSEVKSHLLISLVHLISVSSNKTIFKMKNDKKAHNLYYQSARQTLEEVLDSLFYTDWS